MKKLITIIFAIVFGIFIGLLTPWNLCEECNGGILDVCYHGFWDWCLRVLEVCGTLGAVFVALFKEWFYKHLYHPSFVIKPSSDDVWEVFDEQNNVSRYCSSLIIKNTGSACAVNCEVYMSKLEFVSLDGAIRNTLINVDNMLLWSNGEKRIDIPQTFSHTVEWFKVIRGVPQSRNNPAIPSQLFIGTTPISRDMYAGGFDVVFKIVCQGVAPKEIKLHLSWNGKWQDHKSQMTTCLQYHIVS